MPASCFWELARLRPDRAALTGLAARARADEARHQERYVTPAPRFVPAHAPDETAADMGLPAGWYRDTAAREGMPQPEDTDTFITVSRQAEADEQAAKRRGARHAIRRLVRGRHA
jgi:hypothetical protein